MLYKWGLRLVHFPSKHGIQHSGTPKLSAGIYCTLTVCQGLGKLLGGMIFNIPTALLRRYFS